MSVTRSPSGDKTYLTTTNTFETKFGYHRAVRKGAFIFVSGTTALDPETGTVAFPKNAKAQALCTMERCIDAIKQLGGETKDVVRVRMFLASQEDALAVGDAFRNCFGGLDDQDVGCAATLIVVKDGFVDPDMLVEVEVDAVV